MLIRLRAFGGKLQSNVFDVGPLRSYRFRLPYMEMTHKAWEVSPSDCIPAKTLEFEYRGEQQEIDGKLVWIMDLVSVDGWS
jgi:hypothetical protein